MEIMIPKGRPEPVPLEQFGKRSLVDGRGEWVCIRISSTADAPLKFEFHNRV